MFTLPSMARLHMHIHPAIYIYDLDHDIFPVDKRMFPIFRTCITNEVYVDDIGGTVRQDVNEW